MSDLLANSKVSTGKIVSGNRELSHQQLMQNVAKAEGGFSALGVQRDDAVAILLRNDFPYFEVSMAANLIGAYAVPINWHFVADEISYILRDSEAKILVVHADLLPPIEAAVPSHISVLVVPTPAEIRDNYGLNQSDCDLRLGDINWIEWLEVQQSKPFESPPTPTSMIYTSGTTGNPKGVRRQQPTAENAVAQSKMVATIFGFAESGDFRTVITGPMYHAAPNLYATYAARNGGFCELQPRFNPEQLLALIEKLRISHLHMVPTMFVRLLQMPEETRNKYNLSSLKFVVHAAAPCSPEVKRKMIEWWGPIINEYYGATETGGVIFHTSKEALEKPGTVGRPIENGHVKIFDDNGNALGPKEIGLVYLKLDGLSDFTYNHAPEKRREVGRDNMVTPGDMGYVDEDGYLFLCDRKNDMVISGGVNIYPAEIEGVLINMPELKDCAIFGIPDEQFGEALCAYIQPQFENALTVDDVKHYLVERVAKYKIPKVMEFVNELPREDSGKIFKRKLRAPYWESATRNI